MEKTENLEKFCNLLKQEKIKNHNENESSIRSCEAQNNTQSKFEDLESSLNLNKILTLTEPKQENLIYQTKLNKPEENYDGSILIPNIIRN